MKLGSAGGGPHKAITHEVLVGEGEREERYENITPLSSSEVLIQNEVVMALVGKLVTGSTIITSDCASTGASKVKSNACPTLPVAKVTVLTKVPEFPSTLSRALLSALHHDTLSGGLTGDTTRSAESLSFVGSVSV